MEIKILALQPARIILLAGEPFGEEVVSYGPFVMNTMGEIKEAFLNYRNGSMGKI